MKRNRPYDSDTDRELFDDSFHAASMSECTGLIPTAPIDESEVRSYSDIFDIPLPNYRRSIMNDQNRNQNKKDNQNQSQNRKDNQNQSQNRKDNNSNSNNSNSNNSNRYDSKSFN